MSEAKADDRLEQKISPSDPMIILTGIRQFGLAADGSDLRDLVATITALRAQLAEAQEWRRNQEINWPMEIERRNRELAAAEAALARARKALEEMLQYERLRANRIGFRECTCMAQSRAHELAYESGQCPHQKARAALQEEPKIASSYEVLGDPTGHVDVPRPQEEPKT